MNPSAVSNIAASAPIPTPRNPFTTVKARCRPAHDDDGTGYPVCLMPTSAEIAEDVLGWLADPDTRVVLDPDARTWLRYDESLGKFLPVVGTAEQVARSLIREAAASCEHEPTQRLLTGDGPDFRSWLPLLEGDRPTIEQTARSMVELSCMAERAAYTRKCLGAGRSAKILFTPFEPYFEGYTWLDFTDDAEVDNLIGEYDAVPLRAARYAPAHADVPTPAFDALCAAVWPNPAVCDAALRSLSMGFTGRATKYVVYWNSETGRGKSIMAALMLDLLGDYARTVPAKTLFGYSADPQRAAQEIAGTWLAVVEEGIGAASFKADEAFKAVTTGGGDLNARKLYQESRQESATHTILLAVNPEAAMNYDDPAIRARLCPLVFEGDPSAIAALAEICNPKTAVWRNEAPAVLARMLNYARDFWDGKWKPWTVADIDNHTAAAEVIGGDDVALAIEMRTDSNVADWMAASRRQLTGTYRARDLFDHYKRWTFMHSQEAVTVTKFGRELAKVPFMTKLPRTEQGWCYQIQ